VNNSTKTMGWVLLIYKVPSEPSKNRLQVWRRIRKTGAVYLQNGVCVLPAQPSALRLFRALAQRIDSFNGEAFLFQTGSVDEKVGRKLEDNFNGARNREYAELLEEAALFLLEIEQETARSNFTIEEVEEIEQDLKKLRRWAMQIKNQDWFSAPLGATVAAKLAECELALQQFIARAYESDQAAGERAPHV
jgi:hypothetical protein